MESMKSKCFLGRWRWGTKELFIKHLQAKPVSVLVHDPLMRPIHAGMLYQPMGKTAFIELASASGVEFAEKLNATLCSRQPWNWWTDSRCFKSRGGKYFCWDWRQRYQRCRTRTIEHLLARACWMREEEEFIPRGETLIDLDQIDFSTLHPQISKTTFTALCDVQNPFYGKRAACIYAPQKAAKINAGEPTGCWFWVA